MTWCSTFHSGCNIEYFVKDNIYSISTQYCHISNCTVKFCLHIYTCRRRHVLAPFPKSGLPARSVYWNGPEPGKHEAPAGSSSIAFTQIGPPTNVPLLAWPSFCPTPAADLGAGGITPVQTPNGPCPSCLTSPVGPSRYRGSLSLTGPSGAIQFHGPTSLGVGSQGYIQRGTCTYSACVASASNAQNPKKTQKQNTNDWRNAAGQATSVERNGQMTSRLGTLLQTV